MPSSPLVNDVTGIRAEIGLALAVHVDGKDMLDAARMG